MPKNGKRGTKTRKTEPVEQSRNAAGLTIPAHYTGTGPHPFELLEWKKRDAVISSNKGEVIFAQRDVEAPAAWSDSAVNITVSKYFHGVLGHADRESSVRQVISRVVDTLTVWGTEGGYFRTVMDATAFSRELAYLLVNQMASFNSPVWFNVGVEKHPQCSACFINSVEDTMDSILELAKTEGKLFKFGSGTGTNLSPLRSSYEKLFSGGNASGPVSFMKGYDAFAGVIKSGGKTRRAAKMVILNIDHPDIVEFIQCKAKEEKKAWALIEAGYDGSFNGEAYSSIFFQNANNSVRVTDEFMRAVEMDTVWKTRAITTGEVIHEYAARDLMRMIAESAHLCGDPGIQFDSTVNRWNPCKASGRISASNPCSEYMFLDNSACNLASLNLLKFVDDEGRFDVDGFRHAVNIVFTAQEIIVENASYPTPKIGVNSVEYRPIGLGYANLGAVLMHMGLPYDSDEGRNYAAAVTALMTGEAYRTSSRLAAVKGPFKHFEMNRASFMEVIEMHRGHAWRIGKAGVPPNLLTAARDAWDKVTKEGPVHGFRNAQATVLAPTGTIGFMMDCDTTGIEPELALVKYKQLVGDGMLKIVNRTIPTALRRLGYTGEETEELVGYIEKHGTIEGGPHLRDSHLPVFDCALKLPSGQRVIHHLGHVRMMAAVQPFLSGAISKTVNMPNDVTPEDVEKVYLEAWKLGLKSVALYRDGSKKAQPLSLKKEEPKAEQTVVYKPVRRKLPSERTSITHKFRVADHEGYITVGAYENGQPGEIFLLMAKEGSVISGLMDGFATAISMALQYGVPLKVLVDKFTHTRFEPSGFTGNPHIPMAKSILDYIFKWLALKFLPEDDQRKLGIINPTANPSFVEPPAVIIARGEEPGKPERTPTIQGDAPTCPVCETLMVRKGTCYYCPSCFFNNGCS
ncbi:MAG: vitamin B12-dependent ribonucleotide reductase [Acidobacteria bacterium]|nr:vitamin B12-dependent ribonucleotide reductase [Acidobacteriota bacterium]